MAAARIIPGKQKVLTLGNLNSKRDWGYAPEYCEGMWRMLQQETADDYVLATGETHTIREFCKLAFAELGIEIEWQGQGENEKGIVTSINQTKLDALFQSFNHSFNQSLVSGSIVVAVNPRYYRPTEVELLIGNASKANDRLEWKPKVKFEELVQIMIKDEIEKIISKEF